jgi:dihydroorotase-like cyclic amidohydrolase
MTFRRVLPILIPPLRSLIAAAVPVALALSVAAVDVAHLTAQPAPDLVITGVNVVDVRAGTLLPDRTVVIAGGGIIAVFDRRAPDAVDATSRAAAVLDGSDRYLIPGLLDMHAHLRGNGVPAWITTDWMMPLILAHGVTGVRDMNSDCENPNQGPVCLTQLKQWQSDIAAGTLIGPRILALSSFPINPPWDYAVTEAEARGVVGALEELGVTNLKVYDRLSAEALGWIADEARRRGLGVWGHVPLRMTVAEASRAGLLSIEHARDFLFDCHPGRDAFRAGARSSSAPVAAMRAMVDTHDAAACAAVFEALVENGTWYVPTHVTRRRDAFAGSDVARNDSRVRYVPRELYADWLRNLDRVVAADSAASGATYVDFYHKGLEITGAAHRAGVRILVGTDAPDPLVFPGSAVHDEMGELVTAGLTPAEALRAATWNGAEFLGATDRHGSVSPGRRADLVLLDANPLDDIAATRAIRAVILGGRLLDRDALDGLLERAAAAAQRPMMQDARQQ